MHRIYLFIVAVITLPLLAPAHGQTRPSRKLRKVQVTAQAIAKLPSGKPLLIDLTRTGTIYALAAGIDYSRVHIRTSTGVKAMSDLVKQRLGTTKGELLVGNDRIKDLYSHVGSSSAARISGTRQFSCTDSGACKCKGYFDCLAMQTINPNCRIVIIDEDTGYTYCIGPLGP